MMKTTWRVIGITGIVAACGAGACLLPGCGKEEGAGAKAPALRTTPAAKTDIPLPEWAPKNPSPEFLRAARVLKPMPEEMLSRAAETAGPEGQALLTRIHRTWTPTWEFFGTLDDSQIERFRTTREIRIPIKSLAPEQRDALDRWFESFRTIMKGTGPELEEDYLVSLYKMGGKEDLSNVDVGFVASARAVQIWFWVKQSNGAVQQIGTGFAQM
jgi:hypothetical protein